MKMSPQSETDCGRWRTLFGAFGYWLGEAKVLWFFAQSRCIASSSAEGIHLLPSFRADESQPSLEI